MIVLHELLGNAELGVHVAAVALVKEAPLVAVNHRPDEHRAFEPYVESLHRASSLVLESAQ